MSGLPPELDTQCREVLLQCSEFENDSSLSAVFSTNDLSPFKSRIEEASSLNERVSLCLSYLSQKYTANGSPALAIFLKRLSERYDPGDALHSKLTSVYAKVDYALRHRQNQENIHVYTGLDAEKPTPNPKPLVHAIAGILLIIAIIGLNFYIISIEDHANPPYLEFFGILKLRGSAITLSAISFLSFIAFLIYNTLSMQLTAFSLSVLALSLLLLSCNVFASIMYDIFRMFYR